MEGITLTSILKLGNLILSSANVIIGFSLLVYILTRNHRSPVARSFCALLAFVTIVYVGDVMLINVDSFSSALLWLKFQWIGIALVPAAYLHLSDALLRTTNSTSSLRRALVVIGYALGLTFFLLAISTTLLVRGGVYSPWATHFMAGPLFWLFALYFLVASAGGAMNIQRARRRCLTPTSKRRMTYLAVAFAAPGLGVFPYLLIAGMSSYLSPNLLLSISLIGNMGIAMMTIVMAYSVAYHGALMPDRVVKHSLIHYLLRGPLVGTCVVGLMLVIPRVERILGLPRDTVLIFAVVLTIVLMQVIINLVKPYIDRLIYRQDREEVTWIQELDERLLTTTDLKQLLENILSALCDLFRVRTGLVATMEEVEPKLEASCGSRAGARNFLDSCDLTGLNALPSDEDEALRNEDFIPRNGYWLLPLHTRAGDAILGILGVEARCEEPNLTARELELTGMLVSQAALALEDRQLQQGIFAVLQQIAPEIESIQRWRSALSYAGPKGLERIEDSPIYAQDFQRSVKEALDHYWGGPKLTRSPLLKLAIVEDALRENDHVPAKALRSVLRKAIETLRPEGQRSLTAREWILYNILEMRFIQGRQIKEIIARLAMSESDFYRKQRVAIEEVAKTLANMERRCNSAA